MHSIPSLTLSITYNCHDSLTLPSFPGSLLRGLLGPALRDIYCVSRKIACGECLSRCDCLYPYFFEDLATVKSGLRSPPRPFVIHLEWTTGTRQYNGGDLVGFAMTLFSEVVWRRLPHLVAALDRLGRNGIGQERTVLTLESIDVLAPSGDFLLRIFEGGRLQSPPQPSLWPDEDTIIPPSTFYEVEVELITPLILRRHGRHLDEGPPCPDLVRALLRRRHDIIETFIDGSDQMRDALKQDASDSLLCAQHVVTGEVSTRWQHHRRHSWRKNLDQSQSGLRGKITYTRVPAKLMQLLRLGALTHVGGSTSMGMGGYIARVDGCEWGPPLWTRPSKESTLSPGGVYE